VTAWQWGLVTLGALLLVYAIVIGALVALGRRAQARAVGGFVPDCVVLVRRLLSDPRVSRRSRVLLIGLAAYLAMPVDLVPDFIPIAGQLDDVIVAGLVLRAVVRGAGVDVVREHWPGPRSSLDVVLRIAGQPAVS
jgi:uncharacterized membrane protein YkvA (DUF1232 family)